MKARAKKIDVLIDGKLRHVKVNDENVPSLFDSENGGGELVEVQIGKRHILIAKNNIINGNEKDNNKEGSGS